MSYKEGLFQSEISRMRNSQAINLQSSTLTQVVQDLILWEKVNKYPCLHYSTLKQTKVERNKAQLGERIGFMFTT